MRCVLSAGAACSSRLCRLHASPSQHSGRRSSSPWPAQTTAVNFFCRQAGTSLPYPLQQTCTHLVTTTGAPVSRVTHAASLTPSYLWHPVLNACLDGSSSSAACAFGDCHWSATGELRDACCSSLHLAQCSMSTASHHVKMTTWDG